MDSSRGAHARLALPAALMLVGGDKGAAAALSRSAISPTIPAGRFWRAWSDFFSL